MASGSGARPAYRPRRHVLQPDEEARLVADAVVERHVEAAAMGEQPVHPGLRADAHGHTPSLVAPFERLARDAVIVGQIAGEGLDFAPGPLFVPAQFGGKNRRDALDESVETSPRMDSGVRRSSRSPRPTTNSLRARKAISAPVIVASRAERPSSCAPRQKASTSSARVP